MFQFADLYQIVSVGILIMLDSIFLSKFGNLSIENVGLLLQIVASHFFDFLNKANVCDVLQRCSLMFGKVAEDTTNIFA